MRITVSKSLYGLIKSMREIKGVGRRLRRRSHRLAFLLGHNDSNVQRTTLIYTKRILKRVRFPRLLFFLFRWMILFRYANATVVL